MSVLRLKYLRSENHTKKKERVGSWSQNIYTIEKVEDKLGQNYYYVEGIDRQH